MRVWMAVAVALALSGCMSRPGYNTLKAGASEADVLRTMNDCPKVLKNGRYEAFLYTGRMTRFFQWAPATYAFVFRDKTLVEFGEGTAKAQEVNGEPGIVRVSPTGAVTPPKQTANASCAMPDA